MDRQIPAPESPGTGRIKDVQFVQAAIQRFVSQLDQIPDIRQEQVNALRFAIGSGQYNPCNDQVAGAIAAQLFGVGQNA